MANVRRMSWNKGTKGLQIPWNKGRVGDKMSLETRTKMSLSKIGHIPWNKDKKCPQISKSLIGRKIPIETKLKMSKSHLGKKLSLEHVLKAKMAMKGVKHPNSVGNKNHNWRGGINPINDTIRKSIEYEIWRNGVFARDGYIDQKTGIRGGELRAHHILNFSNHPELRFAIDNGITLSKESHKAFHKRYGKINNTKEQLNEFLKERE